jgi:hypothetical protein
MNLSEERIASHSDLMQPNTTNFKGGEATREVWSKLPTDIINHILGYDGTMTYRNGKYINKIPNPDENYPLILERMKIQRYRRFLSKMSFVTIQIDTGIMEKEICFWATNNGLKITLFEWDYDNHIFIQEKMLYTNR